MRPGRKSQGFTLLEVLVAVAIIAVVGVAAYRMLDSVSTARNKVEARDQSLLALQRGLALVGRDLSQAFPRPIRNEFGDTEPAFWLPAANTLEFTRSGHRNPLGEKRSELLRVRYRLDQDRLLRETWTQLDRDRLDKPRTDVVMTGLSELRWQVNDARNGQWLNQWPANDQITVEKQRLPMPAAVTLEFRDARYGKIRRIFLLAEGRRDDNAT